MFPLIAISIHCYNYATRDTEITLLRFFEALGSDGQYTSGTSAPIKREVENAVPYGGELAWLLILMPGTQLACRAKVQPCDVLHANT